MKIFKSIIPVTIGIAILAIALTNCSKDEPEDLGPIPVADFSASEVLIIKGDTITFTDLSTNTPTLWTWNFEGATPTYSNEASPSVVYEGQGIFSVTLTVRNTAGADEITKEGYIEVTAPPVTSGKAQF